tara:strand:+ start:648 stop:2000 length:1353 start_codon:yes stop_codon:yes gene_type:complete
MALIPFAQKFHTLNSSTVTSDLGSARANSGREVYTLQDLKDTINDSMEPTSLNEVTFVGSAQKPYYKMDAWKGYVLPTPPTNVGGKPYSNKPTQFDNGAFAPIFKIESVRLNVASPEIPSYNYATAGGSNINSFTGLTDYIAFQGGNQDVPSMASAAYNYYNADPANRNLLSWTIVNGTSGATYSYTNVQGSVSSNGRFIFTSGTNPMDADIGTFEFVDSDQSSSEWYFSSLIYGVLNILNYLKVSDKVKNDVLSLAADGTYQYVFGNVFQDDGDGTFSYANNELPANSFNGTTNEFAVAAITKPWQVAGGQLYYDTYFRYLLFGDYQGQGPRLRGDLLNGSILFQLPGFIPGANYTYNAPRFQFDATESQGLGYSGSQFMVRVGHMSIPGKIKLNNATPTENQIMISDSTGEMKYQNPSSLNLAGLSTVDPGVPGALYRDASGFIKVSL